MSDLTPEETLEAEYYDESEPYQGRHVPLSSALAAVAAERERLGERLLSHEAVTAASVCQPEWCYVEGLGRRGGTHADCYFRGVLSAAWRVAREGDTTERKKGNAGEPAKPPPGTIRHRAEGDTTDA